MPANRGQGITSAAVDALGHGEGARIDGRGWTGHDGGLDEDGGSACCGGGGYGVGAGADFGAESRER